MELFTSLSAWTHRYARWVSLVLVGSLVPAAWFASRLEVETRFTELLPEGHAAVRDLRSGFDRTGGAAFTVVAIGANDLSLAERFADHVVQALERVDVVRYAEAKLDVDFIEARRLLYLSEQQLQTLTEEISEEIDTRTINRAGLGLGLEAPREGAASEDGNARTGSSEPSTVAVSSELDLESRFRNEVEARDIPFKKYLVGDDGKYLYVFVSLRGGSGDREFAHTAQETVERAVFEARDQGGFPADLEIRFSGSLVIRLEEDEFLNRDLARASLLGFFSVVILLTAYTRRIRTLFLLSVPLLVGVSWTLAFAEIVIGRLNIISGFLVSILSGLGIEFGIHLLLRYLEQRRRGYAPEAASTSAMKTTGRSLLGSALTNAGAFLIVAFAGFQGFSEFGVIAGVGMLLTLSVTLFLFPACNMLLERWRPMKVTPIDVEDEARTQWRVPRMLQVVVLTMLPVLAAYSVYAIFSGQVRFRTNWRELKGSSPASDFDDYIVKSLGGSFTQSLVLANDEEEIPAILESIEAVRKKRTEAGLPFGITRTVSVHDLVPPSQKQRAALVANLRDELDRVQLDRLEPEERTRFKKALELTDVEPFELTDVPKSLRRKFETVDGKGSIVVLRTNYLFYESDEVMSWADQMDDLRSELDHRGLASCPIISENWIAGTLFKIIVGDGPFILFATLGIVFVILYLDFRKLKHALAVLGALGIGQLSIAGAMALLGMELNFMNAVVVPIIVGISIDNAVHIYHRYLEEGPASIPRVLRYTATATALSSATNMLGFGSMIVAHHQGLRSVGWLAVVGISLTFFSTSIFFPLALGALSSRRASSPPVTS